MFFDPHVVTDAIVVMAAMFAPAIMAVDPMMAMLRPMAGHPDHFPVALIVTRAMAVIRPITDFDAYPCRLDGGPQSDARNDNRDEQH